MSVIGIGLGIPFASVMGGGGGGGPTPPPITTGLELHLDSRSGVQTDVDGVYQWDDLSGNDRHVLQSTGSSKPAYLSDARLGIPGVKSDGVDDQLSSVADTVGSGMATIYLVGRYDLDPPGISPEIFGIAGPQYHLLQESASRIYSTGVLNNATTQSLTPEGSLPQSRMAQITSTLLAPNTVVRIDGSQEGNGANCWALTDPTVYRVGREDTAVACPDYTWQAILVYSEVHTAQQIAEMEAWLREQFKLDEFDPRDAGTLLVHNDANVGVLTDPDGVYEWSATPLSLNTAAKIQSTGASKPQLVDVGGFPAVQFDGTDDWVRDDWTVAGSGSEYTFYTAFAKIVSDGRTGAGNAMFRCSLGLNAGNYTYWSDALGGRMTTTALSGSLHTNIASTAAAQIHTTVHNGIAPGSLQRFPVLSLENTITFGASLSGLDSEVFSASGSDGSGSRSDTTIYEHLVYQGAHDASTIAQVEQYLSLKWLGYDTTLQLHLDANVGVQTDVDGVYQWTNQALATSSDGDLTQSTGASKPEFLADARLGLPGVQADGVDDWLANSYVFNSVASAPHTTYLVVQADGSNAQQRRIISTNASTGFYGTFTSTSAPGTATAYNAGTPVQSGESIRSPSLVTCGFGYSTGDNTKIRVDGVETTGSQTQGQIFDGFRLASTPQAAEFFGGWVQEIRVYSGAHTQSQIDTIESELREKWKLDE